MSKRCRRPRRVSNTKREACDVLSRAGEKISKREIKKMEKLYGGTIKPCKK